MGRHALRGLGAVLLLAACGRRPVAPGPIPSESPRTPRAAVAVRPAADAVTGVRPVYLAPRDPAIGDDDLDALWTRQLMVPVEGLTRRSLSSDFQAKRGDRLHGALDLLAPRYTPVLAADDGVIGRLATGAIGGIVIYARDLSDRFVYYYAHLQRVEPGLAVGDTVAKGTVIGYVGTTGNAPPDVPHLHFQVMKRGVGRVWWDGPPIDPLPFLVFDGVRN